TPPALPPSVTMRPRLITVTAPDAPPPAPWPPRATDAATLPPEADVLDEEPPLPPPPPTDCANTPSDWSPRVWTLPSLRTATADEPPPTPPDPPRAKAAETLPPWALALVEPPLPPPPPTDCANTPLDNSPYVSMDDVLTTPTLPPLPPLPPAPPMLSEAPTPLSSFWPLVEAPSPCVNNCADASVN